MTNGEILEKLFPGFEEIQVFSEYILRNGKETIMKVDREFWESEIREATQEEREGVEQYIDSVVEPCGDVISREWLKLSIHNFFSGLVHIVTEEDIQAYIDAAPSIQPKQRTGRWVLRDDINGQYQCDVCGMFSGLDKFDIEKGGFELSKFCSNCGAKMTNEIDS